MKDSRAAFRLTDDEIAWLIKGHRERAAELIARPQATLPGRRLAKLALKHHEGRIELLRAVAGRACDDSAGG